MIWIVTFLALRLALAAACGWGVMHAESAGMSLILSVGFLFWVVDTFRVLVERKRRG